MLTVDEIKMFIDEDAASVKKHFARIGERYFDGDHDIKNYRMFYFNSDGQLVEDTSRANVRIPHPFFKELTEQGTQYTLSGSDGFVFSDVPELQSELDARFNNNDDFIDELSETLTDCQTKGFAYMYAMKDSTDKLKFTCADSIGVVEVEARFAEDKKDHVIYWYVDRVDKEGHRIKKIMDWDDEQVVYYVQTDEGEIQLDDKAKVNPRPHILYQVDGDDNTYIDSLGFLPFFRLDNNKKQFSNLKAVKDLIDDYDLMASSLSNNLIDFDHPLYAVKGFEGDNLDELQQNLKTNAKNKLTALSDSINNLGSTKTVKLANKSSSNGVATYTDYVTLPSAGSYVIYCNATMSGTPTSGVSNLGIQVNSVDGTGGFHSVGSCSHNGFAIDLNGFYVLTTKVSNEKIRLRLYQNGGYAETWKNISVYYKKIL